MANPSMAVARESQAAASHAVEGMGGMICRRLDQLTSLRSQVESVWRQCFDYSDPIRGIGFATSQAAGGIGADLNIGYANAKRSALLDGTAGDASRILASAIVSGSTPSNSRWIGLDVEGADEEGKAWLDGAAETLWENIHNSNYDSEAYEAACDLVGAGMFALFIDEDRSQGGFKFELWPLSQCYCAASLPGGIIDTVYRAYEMTAEQACNEFGMDAVSESIRKACYDTPDHTFGFVHAIYPRTMHAIGAKLAKNLPIASCTVERATKNVVRESGFHEMPVIVPRWKRIAGSHLAVGPMYDALADAKTLNKQVEFVLMNADLATAGMWIAEDDGVLNPRTIRIGPRKVVVANSVDSMKPLVPGSKFEIAIAEIARLQESIRKVLMADQLTPKDGPAMTATEIHVRVELLRQLLGPIYGRIQAEWLQSMVIRCFGIAYRAGVFLPPPASIVGREMSVVYLSPMARSQKAIDVVAMDRYEGALAQQAAAGLTDSLDLYKWDEARRRRAELLGVPLDLLPTEDELTAHRQAKADAQQRAQSADLMQQMIIDSAPGSLDKAMAGGA